MRAIEKGEDRPILVGLWDDYRKYEMGIFKGEVECPFKVEFQDAYGNVISNRPVPLTVAGNPKIKIFG